MCPVCGARQFLGFRNLMTVRKHMKAINLTDSDLSTFHALCKRAKEDRDNLFDTVYFACKKHLDVPGELYDIDDLYAKEIKFILNLIAVGLVTNKYEYDEWRRSISFLLATSKDPIMKITCQETDAGNIYTIHDNLGTTTITTDHTNHVRKWNSKTRSGIHLFGDHVEVNDNDNDKEA
jgi:hypothetical protein